MRRRRRKRRERKGIWRREDRCLCAVKEVQQASVLCVVLQIVTFHLILQTGGLWWEEGFCLTWTNFDDITYSSYEIDWQISQGTLSHSMPYSENIFIKSFSEKNVSVPRSIRMKNNQNQSKSSVREYRHLWVINRVHISKWHLAIIHKHRSMNSASTEIQISVFHHWQNREWNERKCVKTQRNLYFALK